MYDGFNLRYVQLMRATFFPGDGFWFDHFLIQGFFYIFCEYIQILNTLYILHDMYILYIYIIRFCNTFVKL